jgi:hypothetical protein
MPTSKSRSPKGGATGGAKEKDPKGFTMKKLKKGKK